MANRTKMQAALAVGLVTSLSLLWIFYNTSTSNNSSGLPKADRNATFSVGFDLTHSYGIAAVDYHNGTVGGFKPIAGNEAFREVMQRLSLYSSCHLAPPYNDIGDSFKDQPRQLKRAARKKLGLPASADVGVLANMLQALKDAVQKEVAPEKVSSALVAVPHLPAIYEEDLVDAFEYIGLEYITHKNWYRPVFYETAVAYAGNCLGLCSNYTDLDACREEQWNMTSKPVMAITYTKHALTTTFAMMSSALGMWAPPYRTRINTKLGGSVADTYPGYWDDVKLEIRNLTDAFPNFPKPEQVLILGDISVASSEFGRITQAIFDSYGTNPVVFADEPLAAAAIGAADFAKRAPFAYPIPRRPPPNATLIEGMGIPDLDPHVEF